MLASVVRAGHVLTGACMRAWSQVLEWVMSYDGVHAPEPLAITAAAAALLISDMPFTKGVAAVRVGWLPGKGIVINPTIAEMVSQSVGQPATQLLRERGACLAHAMARSDVRVQ